MQNLGVIEMSWATLGGDGEQLFEQDVPGTDFLGYG